MQDTTLSFYVLDTAQDFLGVDNRVVHSSGVVKRCIPNVFLKLIERFWTKELYDFCHALVPLLCPLVSKCE